MAGECLQNPFRMPWTRQGDGPLLFLTSREIGSSGRWATGNPRYARRSLNLEQISTHPTADPRTRAYYDRLKALSDDWFAITGNSRTLLRNRAIVLRKTDSELLASTEVTAVPMLTPGPYFSRCYCRSDVCLTCHSRNKSARVLVESCAWLLRPAKDHLYATK